MEKVQALHTKLQWLGIPVDGTTYMFCDNEIVVKYTSRAEITLSNKHQFIFWHSVREDIPAVRMRFLKDTGKTKMANIFNK